MVKSNGHRRPPTNSGKENDPDNDFPIREAYSDHAGQTRQFVISYFQTDLGYRVQADEEGKDGDGYLFSEFDQSSPYIALGRVRGRIREALATRYIEEYEPGVFQPTHQTLRGRISSCDGEVGFVIDGQVLTLQQIGKMLASYEGFEFQLDLNQATF